MHVYKLKVNDFVLASAGRRSFLEGCDRQDYASTWSDWKNYRSRKGLSGRGWLPEINEFRGYRGNGIIPTVAKLSFKAHADPFFRLCQIRAVN
jgi:hypothetical protein